LPSKR